jgi:hypothetical protein
MGDIGARWRRIYSNEWHAAELQGLTDSDKVVYFYLRTGPQSTSVGVFRVSTAVAVEDIGGDLNPVQFEERLSRVCEAFGWRFDVPTRVLWIQTWFDDNPPQSPNVCKSWAKLLVNLPDSDIKFEAAAAILRALKDMPQAFREAFGSLPKDYRKSKAKPQSQPQSQPESNQGAGDSGKQRTGKQRTGALRAGAVNEGDDERLRIARRAVRLCSNGDLESMIDHFHHVRLLEGKNGKSDDWKRADIIDALNIAIAERTTR